MALRRVTTLLLFLTLSQMSLALPRHNNPIPVTFCCKDNEIVKISNKRSFIFGETSSVKCSRARNDETSSPRSVLAVNPAVEGPQGQVEAILSKEGEPANFACPVQKYNIDTPSGGRVASSHGIELRRGDSKTDGPAGNVWVNGKPVCDDEWGSNDARVACRMLGFADGGSATTNNEFNTRNDGDFSMDQVSCSGSESSLFDCRYDQRDDCGPGEVAGVRCRGTRSSAPGGSGQNLGLTVEGNLVTMSGTLTQGQFCVATGDRMVNVERDGRSETYVDPMSVTAITCNREKIIATLLLKCKEILSRSPLRDPRDWQWELRNFIKIADTNGDGEVDEEEFVTFGGLLLQDVFNVLDTNDDGGVEAEIEGKIKSIPFSLVSKMIGRVFPFFDYNGNNKLDFMSDDGPDYHEARRRGEAYPRDRYWPSVYDKLFNLVDQNKDGNLGLEEIKNFAKKTFNAINLDGDCGVSSEEVSQLLNNNGLPKVNGLAVKVIMEHYLTLLKYLIPLAITKADTDADGKMSFDELMAVDDLDWFEYTLVADAVNLGYPDMGPIELLSGEDQIRSWEDRVAYQDMWEKAFENFIGKISVIDSQSDCWID